IVDVNNKERWDRAISLLRGPPNVLRVPYIYDQPPTDFVRRADEFAYLKKTLLRRRPKPGMVALRGPGGYGKTTLAQAICDDSDIQEAYLDGILWISLGERPEDITKKIVDLVEALTGERPGFETKEIATRALAASLRDRRCLFVVDDVWQREHL